MHDLPESEPDNTPLESLADHKDRIFKLHESIRNTAQSGLRDESRIAHLASKPLETLTRQECTLLADYAASPHGMERFMSTQIENNLAQFLDNITPVQLVF